MQDFKVTFNFNLLMKKATDEMCAVNGTYYRIKFLEIH